MKPHDITPPGKGVKVVLFPFHVVKAGQIPEGEAHHTSDHRIIVSITDAKIIEWKLDEGDLNKVLFQIARDEIARQMKHKSLPKRLELAVSSESHPSTETPFDVRRLPEPEGHQLHIRPSPC